MNTSSISGDSLNCPENSNVGNQNQLNFPQIFPTSQQSSKANTQRPSVASLGHTRNNSAAKNGNNSILNLPPHPNTPLTSKYSSQRNSITNQNAVLKQANLNVIPSSNHMKNSFIFDFDSHVQAAMKST